LALEAARLAKNDLAVGGDNSGGGAVIRIDRTGK